MEALFSDTLCIIRCFLFQKISQPKREEAAGPVQPAGERAVVDGVDGVEEDGQVDRAEGDHQLPAHAPGGGGAQPRARHPGGVETLLPLQRGVHAPHPRGAGWLHRRLLRLGTGALRLGECYCPSRILAGKSVINYALDSRAVTKCQLRDEHIIH